MDKLSILGLFIALGAIAIGYSLEGGVVSALFNGPALIIVVGGTLGAVMLQTSSSTFKKMLKISHWVFISPKHDVDEAIEQVKQWSHKARQEGYLALENEALTHPDPYAAKGLSLLVDGCSEQKLRDTLEIDLLLERDRLLEAGRVYEAMGGYSPTIGILGAVLGLIQAMSFITDPQKLGAGVATAFIATIYGVGLANLLFLPMANKLKQRVEQKMLYHELLAEGVIAISLGESPVNIELKLEAYRVERPNLVDK
ncbi:MULTISPECIES: flagellar motor protein [Pseudoalteromonas]|uniref:Flagellar motor protein n=1 Tax=Pseudoalteromonas fuliginea TaxID=1872678 RepID=A0A833EL37_9GAMM|nr:MULTISPECIES: flagellar motor protein [Pseudoalteromonas]ALQ08940.1 flagellar motor protein [Pseudoalteromonas sp. Bsw20308]KAA1154048.1 flagellar motor protein [Pseudoalteromonas fuliginea]KAA1160143.1 flagellar motor protein [Pseudoalteromonas fuliginea]KAA1166666.1 flagellar motor protein [Pseudoalteromonas fuliginea]MDQ2042995.1 flagellar motor protein [Pseudoalteromonas sp. 20-92]